MLMAVKTTEGPEMIEGPHSDLRTRRVTAGLPMIEGAACEWPRGPRVGTRPGHQAWYLLQARSGAEVKLTDFLEQFNCELYYPKTLVLRQVAKRLLTPSQRGEGAVIRRPQLTAIFPSYPFIRFDIADERCHEMFKFAGVYGLHCTAERPVVVDDAYISHLRMLEQNGVIPASTSLKELFAIGETVAIRVGAFKGFTGVMEELPPDLQQQINEGVLSELDESMCATIGVMMFGKVSSVKIPMGSLQKSE